MHISLNTFYREHSVLIHALPLSLRWVRFAFGIGNGTSQIIWYRYFRTIPSGDPSSGLKLARVSWCFTKRMHFLLPGLVMINLWWKVINSILRDFSSPPGRRTEFLTGSSLLLTSPPGRRSLVNTLSDFIIQVSRCSSLIQTLTPIPI